MRMKTTKTGIITILIIICWFINLVQFIASDFREPYRQEILKGIGIVVPFVSCVTVFIDYE